MNAERIPGENRWVVPSSIPSQSYIVDMECEEYGASCSCNDFLIRCLTNRKETKMFKPYGHKQRWECKHLHAVRQLIIKETENGKAS